MEITHQEAIREELNKALATAEYYRDVLGIVNAVKNLMNSSWWKDRAEELKPAN